MDVLAILILPIHEHRLCFQNEPHKSIMISRDNNVLLASNSLLIKFCLKYVRKMDLILNLCSKGSFKHKCGKGKWVSFWFLKEFRAYLISFCSVFYQLPRAHHGSRSHPLLCISYLTSQQQTNLNLWLSFLQYPLYWSPHIQHSSYTLRMVF